MRTYDKHASTMSTPVRNNDSKTVDTSILPVNNRPEAVTQRKIQQLADKHQFAAPVVQRVPESDALSREEEKDIRQAIKNKQYDVAVQLLGQTNFYSQQDPGNVKALKYAPSGKNYGQAVQDYNDNNKVDILLEPAAFKSIPILVSTLYHETIHAEQYKQPSMKDQDLKDARYIHGQAREGSKYIEAAQEIETYAAEIAEAESFGTHYDEKFMRNRGIGLSNFYSRVYQAGKKSKTSKQGQFLEKVKPLVIAAYEKLESYGIDTDDFDRRGLDTGSKKRKKQPDTDDENQPSNDNNAQQPPVIPPSIGSPSAQQPVTVPEKQQP